MADVLACVPVHGLEAVEVACELILESGNTSAEHVLNVLSRLKATPTPPTLETCLGLAEAPRADAERYDRLHESDDGEVDHA